MVVCLSFRGMDIAQGFHQAMVVEPQDPWQGRQFHGFLDLPRCAAMNQLDLAQRACRLGQGVLVTVALAPERGFDASLGQRLGMANADGLWPMVRVMHRGIVASGLPGAQGLLQGAGNKAMVGLLTRQPTRRRAKTSKTSARHNRPYPVEMKG